MLAQLQQRLRHEAHQGRNVALIIDEAQHLPLETLEQLLLLANLTPAQEPPLQIVLVGQPELQQHLRRRGLRRVAQRIGIRATISALTEAESLAYIRQRVAKVALPGGPIFTQGALQAIVRHAHGVPHDVNLLCTNVLQAGFWAQQQPITADLVQQVMAASTGSRPFPLGRLGLAAAAGLVLTAGLLWIAPFRLGQQARRSSPAAACAMLSLEAAAAHERAPALAPRLPQPEPAPRRVQSPPPAVRSDQTQARATSASGRWSPLRASAWRHRPPPQLRQPPPPTSHPTSACRPKGYGIQILRRAEGGDSGEARREKHNGL